LERTLISWNVPNLITIPLMAFLGFLVVGIVWQLVMQMSPGGPGSGGSSGQVSDTAGGF
jgi:hypothetical protein